MEKDINKIALEVANRHLERLEEARKEVIREINMIADTKEQRITMKTALHTAREQYRKNVSFRYDEERGWEYERRRLKDTN